MTVLCKEPRHTSIAVPALALIALVVHRRAHRLPRFARLLSQLMLACFGSLSLARCLRILLGFPRGALRRTGPVPGQLVRLSTGLTHYRLRGGPDSAPLVVLVHGFCGCSVDLDPLADALLACRGRGQCSAGEACLRTLQYDNVGRGHSECTGQRPHDEGLFVQQLHELLLAIEGDKEHACGPGGSVDGSAPAPAPAHLIGFSMGGAIVSAYAARYPERVRSLTLLNPAGTFETRPPPAIRWPWLSEPFWLLRGGTVLLGEDEESAGTWRNPTGTACRAWRTAFRHRLAVEPALLRSTLSTLQHFPFGDMRGATAFHQAGRHLRSMGRPVLLCWGTEDSTCPFHAAKTVLELMPGAKLVPLEGAGHMAPAEADAKLITSVVAFVLNAQHAGTGTGTSM